MYRLINLRLIGVGSLGDEAVHLCDDEIDGIRRYADTVARVVIEMFLEALSRDLALASRSTAGH